jgi:hypothetical protein
MSDWHAFIESIPWFVDTDADVRVSESHDARQLASPVADVFPSLAKLLGQSRVTPISVNDTRYELLAWDAVDGYRIGWLCLPPTADLPNRLYTDHADLLRSFGGVIERFNEPEDTWLLNHNDALTLREASHDASFINDYLWAFTDAGAELPIQPTDYYSLAREANGNTTMCHRTTGEVILFAPDHAFNFVTPLDGCPEYTLYKINGVSTLADWVNAVAMQWLAHTAKAA